MVKTVSLTPFPEAAISAMIAPTLVEASASRITASGCPGYLMVTLSHSMKESSLIKQS